MPKLKFVDLKTKKTFTTDKFTIQKLGNGRIIAKAKSPSGISVSRFVSKNYV